LYTIELRVVFDPDTELRTVAARSFTMKHDPTKELIVTDPRESCGSF